jgi:Holliday junction resolvase
MSKSLRKLAKQDRERAEFENFLRISGRSFDDFRAADEPEPDIVAVKAEESFGVEVTNFHRRNLKRNESEEDRVIEQAQMLYSEGGAPNLAVSFYWAPHYKIRKQERNDLTRRLASLIRQNIPPPRTAVHLDWRNFDSTLMSALSDVSINRLIEFSRNYWHAARGGFVPDWDIETLQKEIDKNNPKTTNCRIRYTEIWLLIVSSFGAPSAWMEMTDDIKKHTFRTSFDRVFLLSSFPLAVVELRVSR